MHKFNGKPESNLNNSLIRLKHLKKKVSTILFAFLSVSDFNKLNFAIVKKGNTCLETQNNLNKAIYENLVVKSHYRQDLSLLTLCARNSDDAPMQFCRECDLGKNEWETIKHLSLLQITIKSTQLVDKKQIEAGYQYIKKIVLSALDQ
ncbi:hypothetical protein AB8849_09435 [Proteus vulgaris]